MSFSFGTDLGVFSRPCKTSASNAVELAGFYTYNGSAGTSFYASLVSSIESSIISFGSATKVLASCGAERVWCDGGFKASGWLRYTLNCCTRAESRVILGSALAWTGIEELIGTGSGLINYRKKMLDLRFAQWGVADL